jgi:hypothetical protein
MARAPSYAPKDPALSQTQPAPGWYPDPAGSGGVRWWDGAAWTEHVSLPEPEPEVAANPYLVPRTAEQVDDGLLHLHSRDVVFADAPRGAVQPLAERSKITQESLTSLRAVQVAGGLALSVMFLFIAVRGILHFGGWLAGASLVLGLLVPFALKAIVQVQLRNEFWWQWCFSRGFEAGVGEGPGGLLPKNLNRSPLLGSLDSRVVELAARRLLCRREAIIGCLLRTLPPAEDADPLSTPSLHRTTFVVMPIPEVAASRWAGASIRADHHARRPLSMRAMLGALAPSGVPGAAAHLSIVEGQDPHLLHRIVDARLEQVLVDHPIDVDFVEDLLVVTQDGEPTDGDSLDDLCRVALLLHELVVAEHEVPEPEVEEPAPFAVPDDDQPVVDLSRAGWGEQMQELPVDDQHLQGSQGYEGYEGYQQAA